MFRNWEAIKKVKDLQLKRELVLVDLDSHCGRLLMKEYPKCFSKKEVTGPYPLSVMRYQATINANEQICPCPADEVVFNKAVPSWIPVASFDIYGNDMMGIGLSAIPESIGIDVVQGEVVVWEGENYVVLENDEALQIISIAPAELVDVDIEVPLKL